MLNLTTHTRAHARSITRFIFAVLCASTTLIPASGQIWSQRFPATSPVAVDGAGTAYDSARGQIVMFGGYHQGDITNRTYVWDGHNWTQKFPVHIPPPRYFTQMAYDAAHSLVVMFGGGNSILLGDTWLWDGTDWTQSTASGPSPRYGGAMAYDAEHRQVVLFGGKTSSNIVGETWVWDGTSWTQRSPNPSPAARAGGAMAYDATRKQVVLFGGNFFGDTWVWDGATWTQKSPVHSPSARFFAGLTTDTGRAQLLLFGGTVDQQSSLSDTWVWDGTDWTQKILTTNPGPRYFPGIAYDAGHDQVVMFGGSLNGAHDNSDTWVWTGIVATAGNPQSTPAGQAFSFPLEVTVVDDSGVDVSGATVTFSGPPAFVTFSSPTATTDNFGRASVTATATSAAGSYTVTASLPSGDFATFTLSNVNPNNASAACQVTTGLDDDSSGSLRYQVAACGKGGTVSFDPSLTSLSLAHGQDIQLTQDLTVDGGNGIMIDALSQSRIFFVKGGSIVLRNVTLQNGLAKGGNSPDAREAGGGGAGMGGAVFVNGGALVASNVTFWNNHAQGGNGGSGNRVGVVVVGGGGGMGGDAFGVFALNGIGNGGGGGDLGGSGGTAINSNGGPGAGGTVDGVGGFGGGGGTIERVGSFGGGGSFNGNGGPFGGNGDNLNKSKSGGGGAGLGGAIFVRTGTLLLVATSFSSNSATGGSSGDNTGGGNATSGQGKGGALFINSGATAGYLSGSAPTFSGDSASDVNTRTLCNTVLGATASDNSDICGTLFVASISATSGGGQTTAMNTAFQNPLVATLAAGSTGFSGIPITFSGPTSGASTNPANKTAATNSSGVASVNVSANSTAGGPYTVTAVIGGVATSATYSLTNGISDLTITKTHTGNFSQGQIGATYTITVTNSGSAPTNGSTVTLQDMLPAKLTATAIGGTGWNCTLATLICTRSDVLNAGLPYPAITLTVNVANDAPASVTNQAIVSGGGEGNSANDVAKDMTTINPIVDVSGQVSVTQNGYGRNRATGTWTATMTVTNTSGTPINGPIQVVLTNLTPGVTMVNKTGMRNGSPYITVSAGTLPPGGSVAVPIQFMNPNNSVINFVPVTDSGVF